MRGAIALAILLRLALIALAFSIRGPEAFLARDSKLYLDTATSLATRLEFTSGGKPEIFRTPGYPLLVAAGMKSGAPIAFVLAAQLALSVALVAMTFLIVRRLTGDDRAATISAFIVAIEPTLLLWSVKVMSETLFTVSLLAFVGFAIRAVSSDDWRSVAAAAAALALAAYVKPIAYPLLIVVALASLAAPRKALVFIATAALLVVPWQIRNAREAGFAGFSTLFDRALYVSAGGSIIAHREHKPFADVRAQMLPKALRESPSRIRAEGASLVASDPRGYAVTHVAGMARTLFEPGAVEYLRTFGWYPESGGALQRTVDRGLVRGTIDLASRAPFVFWSSLILGIALLPLLLLPMIAMRVLPPAARIPFTLIVSVIVYFVIVSGGVPGSSRFRAPIVPLLAISGAFVFDARRRASG